MSLKARRRIEKEFERIRGYVSKGWGIDFGLIGKDTHVTLYSPQRANGERKEYAPEEIDMVECDCTFDDLSAVDLYTSIESYIENGGHIDKVEGLSKKVCSD